jgi:hypothetical protein
LKRRCSQASCAIFARIFELCGYFFIESFFGMKSGDYWLKSMRRLFAVCIVFNLVSSALLNLTGQQSYR